MQEIKNLGVFRKGENIPNFWQGAVALWEHLAHVNDFQSKPGFESRLVQQSFAQKSYTTHRIPLCLPKPIGTMALT